MKGAYLSAELRICGDDGYLADGNEKDRAHRAQESEDVVIPALVLP